MKKIKLNQNLKIKVLLVRKALNRKNNRGTN